MPNCEISVSESIRTDQECDEARKMRRSVPQSVVEKRAAPEIPCPEKKPIQWRSSRFRPTTMPARWRVGNPENADGASKGEEDQSTNPDDQSQKHQETKERHDARL